MNAPNPVLARRSLTLSLIAALALACAPAGEAPPTPEEAAEFVVAAEAQLLESWIDRERAAWVQANFITEDTELLAAAASEATIKLTVDLANQANRFSDLELPAEVSRKLEKLKLALTLPAPSNDAETSELAQIAAGMESTYGSGEYCGEGGECRDLTELSQVLRTSRDADELLDAWRGWRTVSPPMRDPYQRFAELGNKGAQELGFDDLGAMWRSKYDMDPDAFAAELDRLWDQVRPLYEALHCHVRAKLAEAYGDAVDPGWADSSPPAGQYVGTDLGQRLRAGGARERGPGLRPDRAFARE